MLTRNNIIKTSAGSMWQTMPFKKQVIVALVLTVLSALLIFLFRDFLPPVVPFFYGEAVGESQLTSSLGLTAGPLFSFVIITINVLLSALTSNVFFKKLLIGGSFLFALLMFITTAKIFFLVGLF